MTVPPSAPHSRARRRGDPDAVVVGAGPNGLAAGIELARYGIDVLLVEANETVGGAARTEEITLSGFRHDVGSAVHPLGIGSPFLSSLPLAEHGLTWIHPDLPLAHPLDGGRAGLLTRDLADTASRLGPDASAYGGLVGPFVRDWSRFARRVLDAPTRLARDPILMARFGLRGLRPASGLVRSLSTEAGRALLAGNAAHAGVALDRPLTGAVAVTLMTAAHAVGWPMPRGGAGSLVAALRSYFLSLGGAIETGVRVRCLSELPACRATLLALTHRQVAEVAGDRLPPRYRAALARWRPGAGAFKVDWALDGPIPWANRDVGRAGTVHVGGSAEEVAAAEQEVAEERQPTRGRSATKPFVLLAQPTLFDPSRAPDGKHVAWGYCHVPTGWDGDATDDIERQVERFAPGFRQRILARSVWSPARLEAWDANLVGGDVGGGALTVAQTIGPLRSLPNPWGTPVPGLYVCSASRPPGGGVHGMVGYHAAREALRRTFGVGASELPTIS